MDLQQGVPMGGVKNAMQRDGLDPSILDLDHEKPVASQLKSDDAADDSPPLKDDPSYSKYFKMLKMVSGFCTVCLLEICSGCLILSIINVLGIAYWSSQECHATRRA